MIPLLRQQYKQQFQPAQYEAYVNELSAIFPGALDFRVAETPVFVPARFRTQMIEACAAVLDTVCAAEYLQQSERAIPPALRVPGDEGNPQFICFDFGVCTTAEGQLEPRLIELQAFPTLFAWHLLMPEVGAKHLFHPAGYAPFVPPFHYARYLSLLRNVILDGHEPEHVILLELFPHQQKTRVDFYATEQLVGIKTVCMTEVVRQGRKLFYRNGEDLVQIQRIYNRVIFDELLQQPLEVREKGRFFQEDLDVTWVPHPNWFYRISKFCLPFIKHPLVPATRFLSDYQQWPQDLDQYVAKPLFSFAGQGVIIDVTTAALDAIPDPQNWILQEKVHYAPAILTPDEPAKAEIRIFYFWEPGAARPVPVNNLARLSKGKMVGTRYNKDKEWVGGTYCLFEQG